MTLTLRSASTTTATTKGAPLTHAEMDANWLHLAQAANVEFLQSGSGATTEPVQTALRRFVHTAQYSTQGNYETARDALTGTFGFPDIEVVGVNGGGAYASRSFAQTIKMGTALYDVGLKITKGNTNSYSAIDIDVLASSLGGKAMRFFAVDPNMQETRALLAYFSTIGAFFNRTGIIVSNNTTNPVINDGEETVINPPSLDPCMIGVWADVIGGIQVRAANVSTPWVWEGLDRDGNKTSSIMEDGSYLFGAGSTHAAMDVGISRASAGVLEINSTTLGTYRDLNLRNLTLNSGKLGVNSTALGGTALDVFSSSSGALAVYQKNNTTSGQHILDVILGSNVTGSANGVYVTGNTTVQLSMDIQQNGNGMANFQALVLGTGDAQSTYVINGGQAWAVGLDNSASDGFAIAASSSLGSSNALSITTGGVVTIPNLAGTGSRTVVADANGTLSAP